MEKVTDQTLLLVTRSKENSEKISERFQKDVKLGISHRDTETDENNEGEVLMGISD